MLAEGGQFFALTLKIEETEGGGEEGLIHSTEEILSNITMGKTSGVKNIKKRAS